MRLKFLVGFSVFILSSTVLLAQTPPPGGGSSVGAPIDGLSSALLIAGAVFASKRIANNRRSND